MYTLKKALGQHFLKDESISKKIAEAVAHTSFENLLEIGPGGGALTKYLLQFPNVHFKAVEIDDEKVAYLLQTFPQLANKIIHQSVLDMAPPFENYFMIAGNFPYNISTEIVFKIIDWRAQVLGMVGMFQKEVAERLAAKAGNKIYGVTSVLTQAFFEVNYLFEVPPSAFTPPPKVVSAVVRFTPRAAALPVKSDAHFKRLVKAAFNQRRKTLRNAVKPFFGHEVLKKSIFDQRAEQLTVADFAALSFEMN